MLVRRPVDQGSPQASVSERRPRRRRTLRSVGPLAGASCRGTRYSVLEERGNRCPNRVLRAQFTKERSSPASTASSESSAWGGWASSSPRRTSSSRSASRIKFLLPDARSSRRWPLGSGARRARLSKSRASTSPASSTSARCRTALRTWSWSTSRGPTSPTSSRTQRPLPVDDGGRVPAPGLRGASPRRTRSASSTATSSRRTSS